MILKVICYVIGGLILVWGGYAIINAVLEGYSLPINYSMWAVGILLIIIGKLIPKKKPKEQ